MKHESTWELEIAALNLRIDELREALKAAQAVFNQIQCYSTGVSVMAEEEMVELFAKYSELMDGLIE